MENVESIGINHGSRNGGKGVSGRKGGQVDRWVKEEAEGEVTRAVWVEVEELREMEATMQQNKLAISCVNMPVRE